MSTVDALGIVVPVVIGLACSLGWSWARAGEPETPAPRRCDRCYEVQRDGARFCHQCGLREGQVVLAADPHGHGFRMEFPGAPEHGDYVRLAPPHEHLSGWAVNNSPVGNTTEVRGRR